jgi:hypothetical protein
VSPIELSELSVTAAQKPAAILIDVFEVSVLRMDKLLCLTGKLSSTSARKRSKGNADQAELADLAEYLAELSGPELDLRLLPEAASRASLEKSWSPSQCADGRLHATWA